METFFYEGMILISTEYMPIKVQKEKWILERKYF